MGNNFDDGKTLSSLVEWLSRNRRLLVGAYLALLAVSVGLFWYASIFAFPEVFARLAGVPDIFEKDKDPSHLANAASVAGFFLLQALFIWGGGRVWLSPDPVRFKKMILSLVIAATWMALLSAGLVFSLAEMANRFTDDPVHPGGGILELLSAPTFFAMIGGSWLIWLLIGVTLVRGVTHHTALSKVISVVLAGSWIEFAIALPIDLMTRDRHKNCVCESGSWLALLVCLPILVWSVGPAIYLLYRREVNLSLADHRRSLRVLLNKSARKAPHL